MKNAMTLGIAVKLELAPTTAAELMTQNPVSVRAAASLKEAIAMLIDRGFSAAPVIDEAGRPVGVLSRSDVLTHDREEIKSAQRAGEYYHQEDLTTPQGERLKGWFQEEEVDRTQVGDLMTPTVFAVSPETPAAEVVQQMLALKVHRLFVVDPAGVMVGVISAIDILRHLRPE
jgi:CBS domain-containing protein